VMMFCFHVYMYWKGSGIVVGFLRHFVAVAPMMALMALDGLNRWMGDEKTMPDRTFMFAVLVASGLAILVYYSFNLIGDYFLSEEKEYLKFAVAFGLLLLFLFKEFLGIGGIQMKRLMLAAAFAGSVVYCLVKEKPLQLAPEHQTVKNFQVYYEENLKSKAPMTMMAHPWFFFFDNFNYYRDPYAAGRYMEMRKEKLDQLPVGSIVAWDSHYSWRLSSNVQEADLNNNPNFKLMRQPFISTDRKFVIYLFEKIKA
jgi:hypothetical protein